MEERRLEVLRHIDKHSFNGRYGVRVPDEWINEANASIIDGQTIKTETGRRLTEKGRLALIQYEQNK